LVCFPVPALPVLDPTTWEVEEVVGVAAAEALVHHQVQTSKVAVPVPVAVEQPYHQVQTLGVRATVVIAGEAYQKVQTFGVVIAEQPFQKEQTFEGPVAVMVAVA